MDYSQVSIVIPNYNGAKLLRNNLPQVLKAAKKAEVIVVDDASTDDSIAVLKKEFPQVKVLKHLTNQRFGQACNTGVSIAKGQLVVLLNSDVIPTADFLDPLVNCFEDPDVFAVGCREIEGEELTGTQNRPASLKIKRGNTLQNDQAKNVEKISGRTEGAFKRGFLVHWKPKDQESLDTLWTFGGSMIVDRKKYIELGGMDGLFAPAYWEDLDLCWRAKEKGWKNLFKKESIVYHNHETTNRSVFGERRLETMAFRNQILFAWKHMKEEQFLQHLFWLPYHIIVTGYRSKGTFIMALVQALYRWLTYRPEPKTSLVASYVVV